MADTTKSDDGRGIKLAINRSSLMNHMLMTVGIVVSLITIYHFTIGKHIDKLENNHNDFKKATTETQAVLQNTIISNNKMLVVHDQILIHTKESIDEIEEDLEELDRDARDHIASDTQ